MIILLFRTYNVTIVATYDDVYALLICKEYLILYLIVTWLKTTMYNLAATIQNQPLFNAQRRCMLVPIISKSWH